MSIILINTDDAYLAITDLLSEEKRALLVRTLFGPLSIPHLEALAERLAILTRKGTPFAAALDLVCRVRELLAGLPE